MPTGAPSKQSALELHVAARGASAVVTLRNAGSTALRVLSHVDAGDHHLDWFTLQLVDRGGSSRVLHLYDNRNESARIIVDLAPGKQIEHVVDVQAWARRKPNGGTPFAPGTYQLSATYEISQDGDFWRGKLSAGPVPIVLP